MEHYYVIEERDNASRKFNDFDKAFKELLESYLISDMKSYLIITKIETEIRYKDILDFIIENDCTILSFKNYNLISNNKDFILPPNIKTIFNYVEYLDNLSRDEFNKLYYNETGNNFRDKIEYFISKIFYDLEYFIKCRKYKLIKKKFNLD